MGTSLPLSRVVSCLFYSFEIGVNGVFHLKNSIDTMSGCRPRLDSWACSLLGSPLWGKSLAWVLWGCCVSMLLAIEKMSGSVFGLGWTRWFGVNGVFCFGNGIGTGVNRHCCLGKGLLPSGLTLRWVWPLRFAVWGGSSCWIWRRLPFWFTGLCFCFRALGLSTSVPMLGGAFLPSFGEGFSQDGTPLGAHASLGIRRTIR